MEVLILVGLVAAAGGLWVWVDRTRPRPPGAPPPVESGRTRVEIAGQVLAPDPVPRTVATLADGEWVLVRGVAERGDALLRAPLTHRECVAWSAQITEMVVSEVYPHHAHRRMAARDTGQIDAVLRDGESRVPLRFHDSARVAIEMDFSSVFDGADRDRVRMRRFLEARGATLEVGQQEKEGCVLVGDAITVYGVVESEAVTAGDRGGYRASPRRLVLRVHALEK